MDIFVKGGSYFLFTELKRVPDRQNATDLLNHKEIILCPTSFKCIVLNVQTVECCQGSEVRIDFYKNVTDTHREKKEQQ